MHPIVTGVGAIAFLAIATVAPIVDMGAMTLVASYQGPYVAHLQSKIRCVSVASGTPCVKEVLPPNPMKLIPDEDGSGLVSWSEFRDSEGTSYFVQISNSRYSDMGKKTGYDDKGKPIGAMANPKKEEFKSIFESIIKPKKADAAIAFDAVSGAKDNSGAVTSLTWSHTVTGTNPVLIVTAGSADQSSPTVTGVTYNGVAMTEVDEQQASDGTNKVRLSLSILTGPATGANNVVVTFSGTASGAGVQLNAIATSYTGASQTGQPDSSGNTVTVNGDPDPFTVSTTVVAADSWITGAATENQGSIAAGSPGAGTTYRGSAQYNQVAADSNGTVAAGSRSLLWGRPSAPNAELVGIIVSIKPFEVATSPSVIPSFVKGMFID